MDITRDIVAPVLIVAVFVMIVWSLIRILHRMGLSGWWVLLSGFWIVMLPILATCRWPALEEKRNGDIRS